jgi:hypothetical protein
VRGLDPFAAVGAVHLVSMFGGQSRRVGAKVPTCGVNAPTEP